MSTPAVPSTSRRARWRWTVALVATGALVVSGTGLVAFAQGGAAESRGPQFVPADATAYAEARLDLPAGQDAALAQFLTAFPGFADPGAFQLKLDEALDAISAQVGASMPEGDLIGDVLTGEIGVGVSDLERTMDGSEPTLIIGLGVADPAAAGTLVEALVAESDSDFTQETYNDVEIFTDDSTPPLSVALDGDWVLLGTGSETVQAALDVLDGNAESLAADPQFSAAWGQVPDARLGAVYVDFAQLASLIDAASQMAEGETGMAMPAIDIVGMLPVEMVAWLEAEDDRISIEALVTPGPQMPTLPVGESDLAGAFPADTQVYVETRELGATVEGALLQLQELLSSEAMGGGSMMAVPAEDLELLFSEDSPFAAMLGAPLPQYLDFVGDAGIGGGLSSDGLWLGIAAEVNDPAVAEERLSSLTAMLTMFLAGQEQGMGIETETVGDVEVTSILIPFDEMMASSGVPLGLGDRISIALDGDELLIGLGDFVESAILSDGSDSLATSARYLDAIGEDVPNFGVAYLDIASLVTTLDPLLAMMGGEEWAQISPYLSALDSFVVVGTAEGDTLRSRMSLIAGA